MPHDNPLGAIKGVFYGLLVMVPFYVLVYLAMR